MMQITYVGFYDNKLRYYILFSTKVNLENEGNLYIACSNPTYNVLVIVLSIIIGLILEAPKLISA